MDRRSAGPQALAPRSDPTPRGEGLGEKMSGNDTLSPEQTRAARRLLDWSAIRLAARSNLGEGTIRKFEEGLCAPSVDKLAAIRAALEAAGVEFTNGARPGVRLRKAPPKK